MGFYSLFLIPSRSHFTVLVLKSQGGATAAQSRAKLVPKKKKPTTTKNTDHKDKTQVEKDSYTVANTQTEGLLLPSLLFDLILWVFSLSSVAATQTVNCFYIINI